MPNVGRGESDRASYWARMVAAWERSALTQAEFCRRRGVNAVTFSGWKGRLLSQADSGSSSTGRRSVKELTGKPVAHGAGFVELRLPEGLSPPNTAGYEIVLPRGRAIRLPMDFDLEAVSRLVTAVESC
jgi:hypothetical protein